MAAINPPANRSGTAKAPLRVRPAMVTPAEDAQIDRLPLWAGYVAAVALPLAVALALIPFRDDLQQTAALILIVPVVVVALLGGTGPAILSAVAAGTSFAVLLTQPYGQFAIHNDDDIVATVVLLLVGLVVGVTAVRQHRAASRAELRRDELERVLSFAELSASSDRPDDLIAAAGDHVRALLHLERCEWVPGRHDGTRPLLLDDGQIMGYLHELPSDRSQLPPTGTALLAQTADAELGSFVVVPVTGTTTSIEQRRTAAGIANLLGVALERSGAGPRTDRSPGTSTSTSTAGTGAGSTER